MRIEALVLGVCVYGAPLPSGAEPRPTEGGLWSFDASDDVQVWDEPTGRVRVHFSVAGPNQTRLGDEDGDDTPDYPQLVALTIADALNLFTGTLGLRPPLPEAAVGETSGGSDAIDVYLVDFGGAADGRFGVDACDGETGHCAGFLVVENDFFGYAYPSTEAAIDTVGAHELFHAVQAAYVSLPIWLSEGTATWAQRQYDPTSEDFERLCNGYLRDPSRPLYEPPPGPVPAFAYGSALWFDFISRRHDPSIVVELLELLEDATDAPEQALPELLLGRDDDARAAWPAFAQANLATGFRAGVATTHPYAASLDAIEATAEGAALDLDVRAFGLSANYWRLEHGGSSLYAGADAPLSGVVLSLHPVADFEPDGVVGDPIDTWTHEDAGVIPLFGGEDLPAGGYWIVAARAQVADGSARARVCIGSADVVAPCEVDEPPTGTATGGSTGVGADDDSSGADVDASQGALSGMGDTDAESGGAADGGLGDGGCNCGAGGGGALPSLVLVLVAGVANRRPTRQRARC